MKINNLLSIPVSNRFEPVLRFSWLPTNLPTLVAAAVILVSVVVVMQKLQETKQPEVKSVAWYMANPSKLSLKIKSATTIPY